MKKRLALLVIAIAIAVGGAFGKSILRLALRRDEPTVLFDQELMKVASELNANLPMQMDGGTRLDTTLAGPGKQFKYYFTLTNVSYDRIDSLQFMEQTKTRLTNIFRASPSMALFREKGVVVDYDYRDRNGFSIAQITIDPAVLERPVHETIPEVAETAEQERRNY
jgi:hypothetical protein